LTEAVGWVSSAILVLTIAKQVYKQWREGSSEGVSKWLFVGQMAASLGFTVYSWLQLARLELGLRRHQRRDARQRPARAAHRPPPPAARARGGEVNEFARRLL
jgi:hypothetical protein